jgi:predicted MFS family arabinose efflux permease
LLRFAAFHAPALRATIATVVVLGTATFVPVWIIAIYAEQAGVPLAWLGPMWAVANYSVALGNLLSARSEREFGLHTVLALSIVLVASGYAGLSLSHATLGFVFYYVLCLGRGLAGPVLNHAQQRLIPSGDRAALISINSLLFRGSFALIGPFIGAGVDAWGNHAILGGLGAFFFTASVAALLWLRGYPRIGLAPTTEEDAEPVP